MKDSGKMIYNMAKDMKNGKMDRLILDHTSMAKNKEQGYTSGMMDHSMLENGMKIKYTEW